jgi:diguanylate cyclase (GGDEF)-like protein
MHADGSRRAVECVISDLRGDPSVKGIVLTAHDVTDRRQLQDRLTHQAFHDALTGLPNRVLLVDRVAHAFERSKRSGADVTLLFLDIDDFKTINDSLGHSAGDELLVEIGERLRHGLRSADTPARLGGDEFALLLEDAQGAEGAGRVAERLLEDLARPITIGETVVHIRSSIGIAVAQPGQTPDELLRNADVAMYWAKRRGGHGYQLFEPQMHEAAITRLELKSDLARAFAADELTLVYQPLVDLQDAETVALEALLRWTHPARGPISPAEFVPLAEETGLINDIGRWVIRQACRDLRHWQVSIPGRARLSANVNLSARQVLQPSFREDVLQILVDTGVEPTDLVLEITESTLLEDVEGVSARLAELREIGIRIAIDDFGTGFSSLGYLQRFPVDELKIAKEFVDEVVDPRRARLVEAIVTLARSLDLRTVAEGIEHEQQGERLRQLGCELGQGYLFSRPVPAGEVPSLLRGVMSSAA